MNIVLLLIPLGLGLVGLAVAALFWAADSGQFDDLDAPGRAIFDDEPQPGSAGPRVAQPGDSP